MKSNNLILINICVWFICCAKSEKVNVNTKQYINKCCPKSKYMHENENLEMCVELKNIHHKILDFSDVPLFYRTKTKTGKKLKDVYSFRYGVMANNDTFKEIAVDYSEYGHNYYLSAEGLLFEEDPNKYNWWTEHKSDRFCIDYKLDSNASNVLAFRFWTIFIPAYEPNKNITINVVGLFISSFFLMLTFMVKLIVGSWGLSDMIKMSYVATTFIAYFLLAVNMIPTAQYPATDCLGMTYTIYFFLMASFSWMVVMSYDVWRLFKLENIGNNNLKRSIKRKVLRRYKWYGIGAWGVPAVLTAFLIVTNHIDLRHIPSFITPNIPEFGCFISGGEKKLYMYIPMLILILINWVFFILTSYNLWSQYKNTSSLDMKDANKNISNQDHRSFKYKFFTYVRLSILSGLSWILEMASSYSPNVSFWIVTDCYNMLTGFFIFLILVCNKRTYEQLRKRFRNKCGCAEYTFFAYK